jgi:hypothetical protein
MEKITKYYTDEEIVEAVLSGDPALVTVCILIKDEAAVDAEILKVKNKEV